MSEDDRNYFRQRAEAEAERAAQAACPEVACVHSQLAAAYRNRIESPDETPRTGA
jgi:hypothetical protein